MSLDDSSLGCRRLPDCELGKAELRAEVDGLLAKLRSERRWVCDVSPFF